MMVFSMAAQNAPCIVLFQYFDAFAHRKDDASLRRIGYFTWASVAGQLAAELNNQKRGVMVIAETNKPDLIDESFLKRFSFQFEIGLPDEEDRREIIKISLDKIGYIIEDRENVGEWLVKEIELLSGRGITETIRKATYYSFSEEFGKGGENPRVRRCHFEKALVEARKDKT